MSAHTKGPWAYRAEGLRGGWYWCVYAPTVLDEENCARRIVDGIHEEDNGEADCRLIASAPRLLEALHEQIKPWTSFSRADLEYWNSLGAIDTPTLMRIFAARAAIHEATGEAP